MPTRLVLTALVALSVACAPRLAAADAATDQFNFAEGLFIHKDYRSAVEEYELYLKDFPTGEKATAARYRIGECRFRLDDLPPAIAAYSAALKADPKAPDASLARYNLGRAHVRQGNHGDALAAFRQVLDADNDVIREEAHVGAGECLLQLQSYKDAADLYRSFLETFAESKHRPAILFSLAWTLVESEKPKEALPVLAELTTKHADADNAGKARLLLADAHTALGNFTDAEKVLKRQLEADADNEAALMRLAWTHYKAGDRKRAAATFLQYADAFPEGAVTAAALYNAAISQYEASQYDEAVTVLKRLTADHPDSGEAADARFWLGLALFETRDHRAAADILKKLIDDGELPADREATALYTYAEALSALDETEAAVTAFRRLLANHAESQYGDNAAYAVGVALEKLGQHEEAVKALESSLETYPKSELRPLMLFALGEYLYRLQQPARALPHLSELSKAPDADDKIRYRLAWIHYDLGNFTNGGAAFAGLAQGDGPFAVEAGYMAGRAFEQAGEAAKAVAQYERLVASKDVSEYADKGFYRLALLYPPEKAATFLAGYDKRFPEGKSGHRVKLKRAEVLFEQGDTAAARALYGELVAATLSEDLRTPVHYGLAWCHLKEEKLAAAAKHFALATDAERHPDLADDAQLQLGEIAYQEKKYADALKHFGPLAESGSPRSERALYMQGWCARHLDDTEKSVGCFESLINRFPDGPFARDAALRVAESRLATGDPAKAKAALDDAIARAGEAGDEDLLHLQGDALLRMEDWKALIAHSETMAAAYPDVPRRYRISFRHGVAAKAIGLYDDAEKNFRDTIARTDTIEAAKAQFNIGTIYFAKKDFATAAKQFLRVEMLYDYEDLAPKSLYYAIDSFVRGEGADSKRAAIYLDKLRTSYGDSPWVDKAAALAEAKVEP